MRISKCIRSFLCFVLILTLPVCSIQGSSRITAVSAESAAGEEAVGTEQKETSAGDVLEEDGFRSDTEALKEDSDLSLPVISEEAGKQFAADNPDDSRTGKVARNQEAAVGNYEKTEDKLLDKQQIDKESDRNKAVRKEVADDKKSDPGTSDFETSDLKTENGSHPEDKSSSDHRDIRIDNFYVQNEHIYTKEKTKWYAAYDDRRSQAHVTFFIEGSGDYKDLSELYIIADNGTETDECKAVCLEQKDPGGEEDSSWICLADFSGEGLWSFTAKAVDTSGRTITKELQDTDSGDRPAILIDNSCPQIQVGYEGSPCTEGDEKGKHIYYGNGQSSVSIMITDGLADYSNRDQVPEITWDTGKDGQVPRPQTPHSVLSLTRYQESYELDQEGTYSFQISCPSKNGRQPRITEIFDGKAGVPFEADSYHSKRIVVDHTPPRISGLILEAGKNVKYGKGTREYLYLNNSSKEKALIRYNIEEENLNPEALKIVSGKNKKKLKTKLIDQGESKYFCETVFDISDWQKEKEGDYGIVFEKLTDKAGNVCIMEEDVERILDSLRIVIDRTGPEFKIHYQEPDGSTDDSQRYSGNSREVFYEDHKKIELELIEENYIAGVSEKYVRLDLKSKTDDSRETFESLPVSPVHFIPGNDRGIMTYVLSDLPEQESHSYFTLSMEDLSGNPASFNMQEDDYGQVSKEDCLYTSPVITLDKTAPLISTSFSDMPSGVLQDRMFFNKPQLMTVVVTDENFDCRSLDPALFSATYSTYDFDEETRDLKNQYFTADWEKGESWDGGSYHGGKKQYTARIYINDPWNYTITTNAEDLAGLKGKSHTDHITLDDSRPYIEITDLENSSLSDVLFQDLTGRRVSFFDYMHFAYFHKGTMRIKITAHDEISGISGIKYKVTHKDGSSTEGTWTFSGQAGKQISYHTIPADAKDRISLVPVDYAGLKGKQMDPRGGVTETGLWHKDHSRIRIRINTKASNTVGDLRYYNTPVDADVLMGDDHSGIRAYSYQAGRSLSGSYDYGKEAGDKDKKGNPDTRLVYERTFHFVLPAGETNYSTRENPTKIELSFQDNAGFDSRAEESFVVDDKKPVIKVNWLDSGEPVNGKYYKTARTAAITVKELNFDESLVEWKLNNRKGVRIGKWKHRGEDHTVNVSFTEEGDDFHLDFTVTDLAGNAARASEQKAFSIDRTAPVITVSFDNNDVRNGRYYNRARKAVLMVQDHNFLPENVKIKISAKKEGVRILAPSPGSWTRAGDRHRAYIDFDKDGEYSLSCICTDLAGNVSEQRAVETFVIDKTAPYVRISGVKDHMAYSNSLMPAVEYRDSNLDKEGVHILLSGNKNGRISPDKERERDIPDGKIVEWNDFKKVPGTDDIYTLAVMVKDRAGNISNPRLVTFSVNRFGSNYMLGKDTEELVQGGNPYRKKPIPIEVTEINVNSLKKSEVSVKNENNEIITLKKGPDYSIVRGENRYGWKSYTYKINAVNFANEGQYTVTVSSVDGAGNRMTNVTRDKNISFVIDQTRPYGAILGLEEKSYRKKVHEISLRADDNYALKEAALYINGKKIRDYSPEELSEEAGITQQLPEKKVIQKVSLRLKDRAGNTNTILPLGNPDGSLISSDRLLQFYYNKPLFYSLLIALAVALAGVCVIVIDKNQRH